jgi:hypothetical protein
MVVTTRMCKPKWKMQKLKPWSDKGRWRGSLAGRKKAEPLDDPEALFFLAGGDRPGARPIQFLVVRMTGT